MEDSKIYRAIDVANWFISQYDKGSGDVITHLKVQKLLYYAEAWSQVLWDRQLFEEDIQAWSHGPVVPAVYAVFRDAGWDPLNQTDEVIEFDERILGVLNQVMLAYGNVSAKVLETMTHEDKPWIDARGDLPPEARCETVIPKSEIKSYFKQKYNLK